MDKILKPPSPIQKEEGIEVAKVVGMMDAAWDAFCKYVQTAELLHKPWDIIFCKGTLLSNAKVAPERLKV